MNEINIELFKFDHKKDYLPYYKSYSLNYTADETILDMLNKINEVEALGYEKNINIKINNKYVNSSVLVSEIVTLFTNSIQIDSISQKRALRDLNINNEDYIDKLHIFKAYISDALLREYESSLELTYYASNTINYNADYIGDHALIIAYDIIKNTPEYTQAILSIISDDETGIDFYTSSKHRMYNYDESIDEKVSYLVKKIQDMKKPSLLENKYMKNISKIFKKEKVVNTTTKATLGEIKQKFENFNVSYYDGVEISDTKDIILKSGATLVEIDMSNDDLVKQTSASNQKFVYAIAADILLQAKDNNADFLVVNDEELLSIFDKKQKMLANIAGREIDLSVISKNQFIMLLNGEKDENILGFNKHSINIEFLASA